MSWYGNETCDGLLSTGLLPDACIGTHGSMTVMDRVCLYYMAESCALLGSSSVVLVPLLHYSYLCKNHTAPRVL